MAIEMAVTQTEKHAKYCSSGYCKISNFHFASDPTSEARNNPFAKNYIA
jgi:hypothetical protein